MKSKSDLSQDGGKDKDTFYNGANFSVKQPQSDPVANTGLPSDTNAQANNNSLGSLNVDDNKLINQAGDKPISDLSSPTISTADDGKSQDPLKNSSVKGPKHWYLVGGLGLLMLAIASVLTYGTISVLHSKHQQSSASQLSQLPASKQISLNVPVNSHQNNILFDQTGIKTINLNGNVVATGNVRALSFNGDGANLTNLNASNLTTGTVDDSLLSPDVTLLGDTIPLENLQATVVSSINGVENNGGDIDIVGDDSISVTPDPDNNAVDLSFTGTPGGLGTITSVIAGTGLTGGGDNGDVALSIDPSIVALQGSDNTFTGNNTFSGNNAFSQPFSVAGTTLNLPGNATSSDTICLKTAANCGASGSAVTSIGGLFGAVSLDNVFNENVGSNTIALNYGGGASDVVQGNTTLTCPTTTGTNLTGGGGTVTLGTGGSCSSIGFTNSPTFTGTLNVQGSGGLVVGNPGATPGNLYLANGTNGNEVEIQGLAPTGTGNFVIQVPQEAGGGSPDTICLKNAANCGTGGSAVTSIGGLFGAVSLDNVFNENVGSNTIALNYGGGASDVVQGNTTLTCPTTTGTNLTGGGGTVTLGTGGSCSSIGFTNSPTFTGTLNVQGSGGLVVGNPGATPGNLYLANGTNGNEVEIQGLAPTGTGNFVIQVPQEAGGGSPDTICLKNAANCGTGGSAVTSIGGLFGAVSLDNVFNENVGSNTIALNYGGGASDVVQGNVQLTCPAGNGNLSGGGNSITLGTGGTCNAITITSSPSFSGTLTVTGSGGVVIGNASTAGSLDLFSSDNNGNYVSLQGLAPVAGNQTITIPATDAANRTDKVCLYTLENCVGTGNGITGSGTPGAIAEFNGSGSTITSSTTLSEASSTVTASGNVVIQGTNSLTLGKPNIGGNTGSIIFYNNSNANTLTLKSGATGASNPIFTLPTTDGSPGSCLETDGSGTLSFLSCTGGGGGGVTSIGGASGVVTLDSVFNVSGSNIALNYGSGSSDVVQGSTTLVCPAGSGNLGGGGNTITLGAGGSCNNITITNNPNFSGNLTVGGTVTFSGLGTGVVQSNSGLLSTGAVVLNSETSGNYVADIASVTGLTLGGSNNIAGAAPTLSVTYGSSASTAVQGSTTLTCPSGSGNLGGGGNTITLGAGGSCNNITITSNPTFTGPLTVTGSGGVVIGTPGPSGVTGNLFLANSTNGNEVEIQGLAPTGTGNVVIQVPQEAGGGSPDTICLETANNCGGVGTTGGSQYYVTEYSNGSATQITKSEIYDHGGVSVGGTSPAALFNVGTTNQFEVSSSGDVTADGTILSNNALTFISPATISTSSGDNLSLSAGGAATLALDSGSGTVNVGIASETTVAVGNASSTTTLKGGTTNLQVAGAGTLTIDGTTSGQGTIAIGYTNAANVFIGNGSATAVNILSGSALNLGNNAVNKTINLGATGSTANTTTINLGTSTGAAQTVNAGSSNSGSQVLLTGGATTVTVANAGATLQSNSTTAFQVQNAGGDVVLGLDTTAANSLIANQGFEVNSTGWSAYNGGGTPSRDTVSGTLPIAAYDGVGALKEVTTAGNTNQGVKYALGAALTPSTTYYLSFEALLSSGTFNDIAAAYSLDGTTGNEVTCGSYNTQSVVTTGWTQINCSFTTTGTTGTSSAYIAIRDTAAAVHTFWIDDVQLQTTQLSPYHGGINNPLVIQNTSNSTTALQVANVAGTDILTVDTLDGTVIIGSGGNNVTISSTGITYNGNARLSKKIIIPAEYAGAVLDNTGLAPNDVGTMTSGTDATGSVCGTSNSVTDMNFYNWTSTATSNAQEYDIVTQVPIPSSFNAWSSSTPLSIYVCSSTLTASTVQVAIYDSNGSQVGSTTDITPNSSSATGSGSCSSSCSANEWTLQTPKSANISFPTSSAPTNFAAGSYFTVRLKLTNPSGSTQQIKVGAIVLNYLGGN